MDIVVSELRPCDRRPLGYWSPVLARSCLSSEVSGDLGRCSWTIDWRVDQLRVRGIANVTPDTPAHGQGVPVLLHMYTNRV